MRLLNLCEQAHVSAGANAIVPTGNNNVFTGSTGKLTQVTPPTVDFANAKIKDLTMSEFLQEFVFIVKADDAVVAARYPWFDQYLD